MAARAPEAAGQARQPVPWRSRSGVRPQGDARQALAGCATAAPRVSALLPHVPTCQAAAGRNLLQAQQRFRERQRAKLAEANLEYDKLAEEVERLRLENDALTRQVGGQGSASRVCGRETREACTAAAELAAEWQVLLSECSGAACARACARLPAPPTTPNPTAAPSHPPLALPISHLPRTPLLLLHTHTHTHTALHRPTPHTPRTLCPQNRIMEKVLTVRDAMMRAFDEAKVSGWVGGAGGGALSCSRRLKQPAS